MKKNKLSKYTSAIGLIVFSAIISLINNRFATSANMFNVLRQTSINLITAVGMTFVILTGGIDLSVGATFAISGTVVALLLAAGVNAVVAVLIAALVGLVIGMINGVIITKGKLQPFIVTLATMTIFRGLTLVVSDGKPVSTGRAIGATIFKNLGNGYILGIPIPIIIAVVVVITGVYLLRMTTVGRYIYAIGSNEEATKLSGINVDRIKIIVYGLSGLMASIAGVIITARLSSAQPTAGTGYELDAIAAVVLGGTSLAGGYGTILGTVTGALIIGVLNNALNLMNVSSYYQLLAKGVVILFAVLIDKKNV